MQSAKAMTLASIGAAHRAYGDGARNEQEVIAHIADMVMDVYAMESALLRTERLLTDRGVEAIQVQADITRVFTRDAALRVEGAARAVACETADEKCSAAIDELAHRDPMKAVAARRRKCAGRPRRRARSPSDHWLQTWMYPTKSLWLDSLLIRMC